MTCKKCKNKIDPDSRITVDLIENKQYIFCDNCNSKNILNPPGNDWKTITINE